MTILRCQYVETIENVSLQPQEVDIITNSRCQQVQRNVGNKTRITNTGMYDYMGGGVRKRRTIIYRSVPNWLVCIAKIKY